MSERLRTLSVEELSGVLAQLRERLDLPAAPDVTEDVVEAIRSEGPHRSGRRPPGRRLPWARIGTAAAALVVAAAGVWLAARAFLGPAAHRPAGSLTGTIAFVRGGGGEEQDIYLMRADGSGVRRLTPGGRFNMSPSWSRDGRRLAFVRSDGDGLGVYVVDADGTGLRRISGDLNVEGGSRPSWSPDGTMVAFAASPTVEPGTVQADIYVADLRGLDHVRLTATDASEETDPAWSPDGSLIAFTRSVRRTEGPPSIDDIPQIYTMAPDGTDVVQLTELSGSARNPAWSPDGSQIVFEGDGDIWLMNADGSGLLRLAVGAPEGENAAPHPMYGNYEPSWSPDGRRIVFASDRDGDRDLYVMRVSETEDRALRLTDFPEDEFQPVWRPGGDLRPRPVETSCPSDIPFHPSHLPEGFGSEPVPGPAPGAPAPEPGQVVIHWMDAEGRAVEVRRPGTLFVELAQADDAPTVSVLGQETSNFGPISPGADEFIVQFTYPPGAPPESECALFSLNEYGLTLRALLRIAEGLEA